MIWLKCKDAARTASDQMDRRLSVFERLSLRVHLFMCGPCRQFVEQLRLLADMVRGAEVGSPDEELSAEARERIKQALAKKTPPQS